MDEGIRLPYLRVWTRTKSGIVLHLSNGTLQVRPLSVNIVMTNKWMI